MAESKSIFFNIFTVSAMKYLIIPFLAQKKNNKLAINKEVVKMLPALVRELADLNNVFEGGYDNYCSNSYPEIDIYEDDRNLYLEASVVGFDKKNISVKVEDNLLTISGKQEQSDSNRTYIKRERFSGSFGRSFNLPKDVKVDAIKAETNNGLLKVVIPYSENKNKKVDIEVK